MKEKDFDAAFSKTQKQESHAPLTPGYGGMSGVTHFGRRRTYFYRSHHLDES